MKFLKNLPSYLLGIIFVLFSVQFFIFVASGMEMPSLGGYADQFAQIMFVTGYTWIVKVLELVIAILILVPRTRALGLVLITPIIVNILIYEFLVMGNPGAGAIPGLVAAVLLVIALYQHRAQYLPMVQKRG